MKNILAKSAALLSLLGVAFSMPVIAQNASLEQAIKIKDAAIKNKIIGEMSNGLLGFVKTPTQDQLDISRAINEINAIRKGVFIEKAKERGQTIDAYALVSARKQISEKTLNGEYFRDMNNVWCVKTEKSIAEIKADGSILIQCEVK